MMEPGKRWKNGWRVWIEDKGGTPVKRGAIFDMDGLLLDTERLYQESWVEMARAFGQPPDPAFPSAVSGTSGEGMREVIRRYYPAVDPYAFQAGCLARVDAVLEKQGPPVKPGAGELLDYLSARGVSIAVASSSGWERIASNLRAAGLERFFVAVVSGQQVERGKPEPDIFFLAAGEIGCPPGDCYVFEDSLNGVRAGMAAGCVTVMVPDLVPPPEGLMVSRVCASLHEARELIEKGLL